MSFVKTSVRIAWCFSIVNLFIIWLTIEWILWSGLLHRLLIPVHILICTLTHLLRIRIILREYSIPIGNSHRNGNDVLMIQDLYILIDLMHHTFYLKISSLRNDTAEFISTNAITFPIAFKIVLYDMCRVDNILIPCPMAILIVTLLRLFRSKVTMTYPSKSFSFFTK